MVRTGRIVVSLFALACLAFLGTARAPRGAEVHITFSGLICHVLDDAHPPRAVTMRGTTSMPHRATLYLQESAIESSEVPLACSGGECVLDLTNTALRFPGAGRATYSRGGSFDTIVPHLRAVTNGEMQALREEIFDEVPSPASPISSSFLLPAGRLSAVAYDDRARYDPDFEGRGMRPFAREVMLDGRVPVGQLLVRRAGDAAWRRITFVDDIELRIVNEPDHPMLEHATLFYDLARTPLAIRPAIVVPAGRITANLTGPGCSNSNYP